MQRALLSELGPDGPEGVALSVRIAIHTGEAFERAGEYQGPTVNRAARIRALAVGGQVLVSESAVASSATTSPTVSTSSSSASNRFGI